MKFQFDRTKLLPLLLKQKTSFYKIARRAGVAPHTLWRAANGKPVHAKAIYDISDELGIDPGEYLTVGKEPLS